MGVSVIIASEWRWVKTICFGSFWVKQQSKEDKTSQQTVRIEDARKSNVYKLIINNNKNLPRS